MSRDLFNRAFHLLAFEYSSVLYRIVSYCALFKNIMFKLSGNVAFYFKKYK